MSDAILIIKLGALGDFIQAAGPFAAIRAHHANDRIALLTTAPFADFARASPWFDEVWIDARPSLLNVAGWLALRRKLRAGAFTRVYDLQTSDRSGWYFRLFGPGGRPEWSGIAPGCSHPHANPRRDVMHTVERQAEQLAMAGIETVPAADFSWVHADAARFGLGEPFALLVPGGARHRPAKRWPAANYAAVAERLSARGVQPVVIGGADERAEGETVLAGVENGRNLAGETSIADLIELGRTAAVAVGNDTGPMHPIAAAGCRSVVLYSAASDPALCAQRGPAVTILRENRLADLSVETVMAEIA